MSSIEATSPAGRTFTAGSDDRAAPSVVITGGSRGIGLGLADAFLARGGRTLISGRDRGRVDAAVAGLEAKHGAGRAFGQVCDVRAHDEVQALWDRGAALFGRVDIWINNAGLGQGQAGLDSLSPGLIADIIDTNCTGALYGCRVALAGMKRQGGGAIYNMEGLGSKGDKVPGMTVYGASKRCLAYITDSVALEAEGTGVAVGALQPGMTATELVIGEYRGREEEWRKVSRIFNILSDRVETVCPWLVGRMMDRYQAAGGGKGAGGPKGGHGGRIVWLTGGKVAWRFISAPFARRRIYTELPD